jgi:hypothetical protein
MGTRRTFAALALFAGLAFPAAGTAQEGMSDRAEAAADTDVAARTGMIVPGILDFRFASTTDGDFMWLDVVWVGRRLDKTATEVRGDLLFYDLAGRLHFGLGVNLQRPLSPNRAITQTGIGIKYDKSRVDHQWLRNTPVSAMRIDFRVGRVLYEDGELVEYSSRR